MPSSNKIDMKYVIKIRGNFNMNTRNLIHIIDNISKFYSASLTSNCTCISILINTL